MHLLRGGIQVADTLQVMVAIIQADMEVLTKEEVIETQAQTIITEDTKTKLQEGNTAANIVYALPFQRPPRWIVFVKGNYKHHGLSSPLVNKRLPAHLAVLSTNLFFAVNYSLVKVIAPTLVKPFALNLLRVGGSLLFFWAIWAFEKVRVPVQKQHWWRFVWCGLTGIAINQMLFIKGLTLTSTVHAALLILATPLLISIFALVVLKEQLTTFKIVGLVVGIGGSVLLISTKENAAHAQNYLLGDLLILLNAISYAVYFILVKPLMQVYSPLQVIRWVFTIGLVLMLPFGWRELQQVQWPLFRVTDYLCLASIIITGTFFAYLFTAYGIQKLGAGTAGAYIYTQPVFAVLIAAIFLGETLSWIKIAAAALIFSGVYLVNKKQA